MWRRVSTDLRKLVDCLDKPKVKLGCDYRFAVGKVIQVAVEGIVVFGHGRIPSAARISRSRQ